MQNTLSASNSYTNLKKSIQTLAMFAGLTCASVVCALPELDKVISGDVNVAQKELNTLQINQTSEKAIVNWNKFNIDAQEKVHFQQPTDGVTLNRINAANGMSTIAGQLSGNGTVLLINGAGVMFTNTAQVNLGGLIASAADISEENFNNEKFVFNASDAYGAIINRGNITVEDVAVLFGTNAVNEGVIKADSGLVLLGAGKKLNLDFGGDGMLNFLIDPTDATTVVDGKALKNGVDNSGKIINDGGMVLALANGTQGVFDNLINVSGEVRASSVESSRGVVLLLGGDVPQSKVTVSGKLDVSSTTDKESGGMIQVLGSNIKLADKAELNVSGQNGGAIIVGLPQRVDAKETKIPATETLKIDSGVQIKANALNEGNGGAVVLASIDKLACDGSITAKGGAKSGNGGNVIFTVLKEPTFNKNKIDVSAAKGTEGKIINSLHLAEQPKLVTAKKPG